MKRIYRKFFLYFSLVILIFAAYQFDKSKPGRYIDERVSKDLIDRSTIITLEFSTLNGDDIILIKAHSTAFFNLLIIDKFSFDENNIADAKFSSELNSFQDYNDKIKLASFKNYVIILFGFYENKFIDLQIESIYAKLIPTALFLYSLIMITVIWLIKDVYILNKHIISNRSSKNIKT